MSNSEKFFGKPVKDERGVIVDYEGGIMQQQQDSATLPSAVILRNLSMHDYTNMFGINDYKEVHNLVIWCWNNEVREAEVKQLLGDWEASHGPHCENYWVPTFVNSLGWPW